MTDLRFYIAAFTENDAPNYPAFVSINRESDGQIRLRARERGHDGSKSVTLDIGKSELRKLAYKILTGLADMPCNCTGDSSCETCDPGG